MNYHSLVIRASMMALSFTLVACTSDPHAAGIFFDERGAVDRQAELQSQQDDAQANLDTNQQKTTDLHQQEASNNTRIESLKSEMAHQKEELAGLNTEVDSAKGNTAHMRAELSDAQSKLDALQSDNTYSIAQKQVQADQLQREISALRSKLLQDQ